jgi:tetratricopeptide (TPR) repeat protein
MLLFVISFLFPSIGLGQSEEQGLAFLDQGREFQSKTHSREDMEIALKKYEEALRIFEAVGSSVGKAVALNQIGTVYHSLGQYTKALEYFEASLAITRKVGDAKTEATTLINIGASYDSLGQYSEALEHYEKGLALKQEATDVIGEFGVLNTIGTVYNSLGKYQKALDYHIKALAITQKIKDERGEAASLSNLGVVYYHLGQYLKTLECSEKALSIWQKIGDIRGEGYAMGNIAGVYGKLGQHLKALEYEEKALAIKRKTGDLESEAITLANMGNTYESWGRHQKALEYYEKALAIEKQIGVPHYITEDSIGNVYLTMGETRQAKRIFRKTRQWLSFGRLALMECDFDEARFNFEGLLKSSLENYNIDKMFAGHTGLGLSYEGLSEYDKAAEHFRKAIELTEQIRDTLTPAQRTDFYNGQSLHIPRITPYEGLARVLLKSGKPEQSFKESEATKARIFAESLSGRFQNVFLDIPKYVVDQDSDINNRLAALSQGLQKAYEKGSKNAIESFEQELRNVRSEKDRHLDELRKTYPLYAATKYPQPMSLEQSALNNDEWTIEYEVTEPGICIYMAHGKNIVKDIFKPIARKDLDELVRKFREPVELLHEDSPIEKLATFDFVSGKKLSDLLLGDILSELPHGTPVIIIPDGSLGAIPFDMLVLNNAGNVLTDREIPQTSGAEFFGDRNPISYYQSVTALTLARTLGKQKKTGERTLAIVDPVFTADDARLASYGQQEQSRLAATHPTKLLKPMEEQNSITFPRVQLTAQLGKSLKNADPSRTDIYRGMEARKSVILAKDLTPYRSVVFATHGYFGKDLPGIQEPVLILTLLDQPEGQDGFLRMSEVMGLNINCDVAALTACQSGLGRNISGEGTMGMGRAFQYAGAKSVLMSLWSVDESASIKLVESFFKHLRQGKSKRESLKLAQDEIRKSGYDHPFFWAPFILVGEAS